MPATTRREDAPPLPTPAVPTPVQEQATYPVNVMVENTKSAWFSLDGKPAGVGRLRRTMPVDGTEHELLVGARGYKMRTVHFKDAPPPETIVLEKAAERPPPPATGTNDALILR